MRPAFLGCQSFGLLGVRDIGGDGLQHMPAESSKGAGVEVSGLGHQVRLRLRPQLGVEIARQGVQGTDQDTGLLPGHPTRRSRLIDAVPLVAQRHTEPLVVRRLTT